MTDYQLIRSKRRTLSIGIDGEGALVVRAPLRMAKGEIEAFLLQKQRWIQEKQALAQSQERFSLCHDARMPFNGGFLRLRLCDVPMGMDRDGLLLLPAETPLEAARAWRRLRAETLLAPRIRHWVLVTGLTPSGVQYTNARKRWGSMSSQRVLRLNTALIHCPPECQDYVIVHELCHSAQMNHSQAFHALVRSFLPHSDTLRKQLSQRSSYTTLLS